LKKIVSNKKYKYIFLILLLLVFGIIGINKVTQNDLFFDLKTGESILKYGIDFKDHFSFIPNLTYIYHHYLYDLIIYYIFKWGGYKGVFFFYYIFFLLISGTILYQNKKFSKSTFIAIFITLFSMGCGIGYITNRIQSITYLLFYLEVILLEKLYTKGSTKTSILIILISILIANLHMPLWIFTLVLFLPFLVESLIYLLAKKMSFGNSLLEKLKIKVDRPTSFKKLFLTFFISSLTGFLTPLKFYPYTFFTKALGNSSFNFINEMKAPTLLTQPTFFIIIFLFLVVLLYLLIFHNKILFRDLAVIVGLLLFGSLACRNVMFVYLIVPTIFTKMFFGAEHVPFNLNKVKWLYRDRSKLFYGFFSFWLLIIGVSYVVNYDFSSFDYGVEDTYPVLLVEYLKNNTDYKNIHIYNDFNYGSYLEYNDIPVFIDSRAEVYIKEFNGGYDIVGDYLKMQDISVSYDYYFQKYQFQYALVYTESTINEFLKNDNNYKFVKREKGEKKDYSLYQLKNFELKK